MYKPLKLLLPGVEERNRNGCAQVALGAGGLPHSGSGVGETPRMRRGPVLDSGRTPTHAGSKREGDCSGPAPGFLTLLLAAGYKVAVFLCYTNAMLYAAVSL